jgi:hypothetical protein
MERHRALSLTLLTLGLWTAEVACTSASRRDPTGKPETAGAPLVYSVQGPFESFNPVLVTANPNPLCVPRYVTLFQWGGDRGYMIDFVFDYASEEWDRDRLAVSISAYDSHGNVLVTETQQTLDHRSRTGPVQYISVALYESSSNQVQVSA